MTDDGQSDLSSEALIGEILFHWKEARERGQAISPAELCRDCPELEPEVARQIKDLCGWERSEDSTPTVDVDRRPIQPPVPPPRSALIALELADLQFHAQGGLGAVYKAIDGGLGREVAVKVPVRPDGTDA